jgi:DNA-binding transcriptional regulator YiaG
LDKEVKRATARRDKAAAMLAAEDAALEALLKAQAELFEAVAEEHLHEEHSEGTISLMQEHSSPSLGVRIASGRDGITTSRKAQLAANLTDKQVAKLLGVGRSTVCKWHLGTLQIPESARSALEKRGIPGRVWRKKVGP